LQFITLVFLGLIVAPVLSAGPGYTPDVLVVKMKPQRGPWEANTTRDELARGAGHADVIAVAPLFRQDFFARASRHFPTSAYFAVRLKKGSDLEKVRLAFSGLGTVESAQPDYELGDPTIELPSDPKVTDQWYLDDLKVKAAWEVTRGEGVSVADVESGFDTAHPDLVGQFDLARTFDYDPQTDNPAKVNDNKMSHGTPVCGIIAARANDIFGVGIAHRAQLIGSQMANSWEAHTKESLWTVNTAKAILGSIEKGASVILIEKQVPTLMSSVERIKVIYDAIAAATAAGIPVIVPAANFGQELKAEADLPDSGSIFVGASTRRGFKAGFSNYGSRVNVAAPGEGVYSVGENNGETTDFGGTSSASAIVAGITALVRAANADLTPRQIRDLLASTGKEVPSEEIVDLKDWVMGRGFSDFADGNTSVGRLVQAGPAVIKARELLKP